MQRPKPLPPLPDDCCGQGCIPCVNDIYDTELKIWEREVIQMSSKALLNNESDSTQVIFRDIYSYFKIKEILPVIGNTFIFRFELPHPNSCLLTERTDLGHHLVLRLILPSNIKEELKDKGDPGYITRQYTILSSPLTQGYFDIMVKLYKTGIASQIIRYWKAGDSVEFRGPYGSFAKKIMSPSDNGKICLLNYNHVVMLSAGTGIAPMIEVAKFILDDEESITRLHLLYSCKSLSSILLKDQIRNFSEFWNFKVVYFITSDEETKEVGTSKQQFHYAKIMRERVNKTFLADYFSSKDLDVVNSKCLFLVCGTKSFEIDIIEYLKVLEVPVSCAFKF
jgi:cytochrome-b5 reductase